MKVPHLVKDGGALTTVPRVASRLPVLPQLDVQRDVDDHQPRYNEQNPRQVGPQTLSQILRVCSVRVIQCALLLIAQVFFCRWIVQTIQRRRRRPVVGAQVFRRKRLMCVVCLGRRHVHCLSISTQAERHGERDQQADRKGLADDAEHKCSSLVVKVY